MSDLQRQRSRVPDPSRTESKQRDWHSVPESGSRVDLFGSLPSAQLRAVETGLCTFSDGEGTAEKGIECLTWSHMATPMVVESRT